MKSGRIKNFKLLPACAALIFFAAVIVMQPEKYTAVCFEGICLWAECVLPSLFPFMVITLLLIKLGAAQVASKPFIKLNKKLRLPNAAAPLFIMSVCSGYPAGSKMIEEYFKCGMITRAEAKKLSVLCSACGPLFALGTVGQRAFRGGGAGIKLFLCCLISVTLSSVIYSLISGKSQKAEPSTKLNKDPENALYSSFYGGVISSAVAGGFICFFYTFSRAACDTGLLKPLEYALTPLFGKEVAKCLCPGLIEATGGCFALAAQGGFFALPLAGFLLTFGGASILLQQLCYLRGCGVGAGFFIGFKFLQGIICFALLCLASLF